MSLSSVCKQGAAVEKLRECVTNGTFSLKETIKNVTIYDLQNKSDYSVLSSDSWTSGMTETHLGVCHRMVYTKLVTRYNMMNIFLNDDIEQFMVFLHDKDFFIHNLDGILIPHIALQNLKSHGIKFVNSKNTRMSTM